jgi:hypothetical protein
MSRNDGRMKKWKTVGIGNLRDSNIPDCWNRIARKHVKTE